MLMVVFLAATGILLNHSPSIGLSKTTLKSSWLMDWYGFETASFTGYRVTKHSLDESTPNQQWLSHLGGHDLFLNTEPVANCAGPLMGASATSTMLLALCKDELVFLTPQGELIEKLNVLSGLPENTSKLQVIGEEVFVLVDTKPMLLNLDTLATQPSKTTINKWSESAPLPQELVSDLSQRSELPGISMETLILDLHSGRFFGTAGILFVDLIGLLICILAITGLWAWYSHYRLRKLGG
jgi:hypothetical protein